MPLMTKLKRRYADEARVRHEGRAVRTVADVEWNHAIMRWAHRRGAWAVPLPVLPILVPLVLVIVSLVFIFTKPLRTAVWDQFAKTLVVSVR